MNPEAEEIVEARICGFLSARVQAAGLAIPVRGALNPAPEGEVRQSGGSFITVYVDQAESLDDMLRPPCRWTVRVAVRVDYSEDPTGDMFRLACRAVRSALGALLGDSCASLDGDGYRCDALRLDATATEESEDAMAKTYTATVTGRFIPPTQKEAD